MQSLDKTFAGLFSGDVAVVTGGAQGIGFAAASGLAAAGCRVVILDRAGDRADQAAKEITSAGHSCIARQLDIASSDECRQLAAEIGRTVGAVAVLINNAGTSTGAKLADENFDAELHRVFGVNLFGLLNVSRAFLSQLEQTRGAIVNVSSITAFVAGSSNVPYASSKAAVTQATRSMARELGLKGVRVNAIAPGLTKTPLAAKVLQDQERVSRNVDRSALKRLAETEDMVGPILFLASRMSSYVTGVTLPVDGGYLAC